MRGNPWIVFLVQNGMSPETFAEQFQMLSWEADGHGDDRQMVHRGWAIYEKQVTACGMETSGRPWSTDANSPKSGKTEAESTCQWA